MPDPQPLTDATEPLPRILGDLRTLADAGAGPAGIRWRLGEPGRQLDANVVQLDPGQRIDTHTEPDLDVFIVVVAGEGTVDSPADGPRHLSTGALLWLPHGTTRNITAGEGGLSYLTVHRRRPGMQIGVRRTP